MFSDEYIIDDSTMPSPEEESQYPPLTAEQKRKLDERLDKVFEEFFETINFRSEPKEEPTEILNVAKYILEKLGNLTTLQLQKLCYYAQAWHYTWTGKRLIKEDFQAWVNGPVCPELYNLHKYKMWVTDNDFPSADIKQLSHDAKDSIDIMLEHYSGFSGDELTNLTHSESPWKNARGELSADDYSNEVITLESMGEYYSKHLI